MRPGVTTAEQIMPENTEFERVNSEIDKRVKAGVEYRMTAAMEARADEKEGRKIVRGYATTFGEEYLLYDFGDYKVYESVDRHAFDGCDMSDVIMQYDHQGRVFARNRNKTLTLQTDDHGLLIEADLSGTELGGQLYEEIRGGYTDKMSMAFKVAEDKREVVEDHENNVITVHRTITKFAKLFDVSAVSYPANDGTEISARSFSSGIVEEIKKESLEAEKRARKARSLLLYINMKRED